MHGHGPTGINLESWRISSMKTQAFSNPQILPAVLVICLLVVLGACTRDSPVIETTDRDQAPSRPPDLSRVPDAVPKKEPRSRYGNPPFYEVFGKRYFTLSSSLNYVEKGIASWYGTKFHGRRTSSGEPYDMYGMTAAHKTLPLPTYARVSNLRNGRSVVLRINDRGPFHENRIIDLSYAAATRLGIIREGTGLVKVEAIDTSTSPAAPDTVAASPLPDDPSMFLQVGAFSRPENAERLRTRLQEEKLSPVNIVEGESDNGHWYRVRIGQKPSVDENDRISASLAHLGIGESHVVID